MAAEAEANDRAFLYAILSCVFSSPPTPEFIDQLSDPEIADGLSDMGVEVDFAAMTDEDLQILNDEYAYLFSGPGPHLPPYESVQRLGQMLMELGDALDHEYEQSGLVLEPILRGRPDHLASELAYMSHLCRLESAAFLNTDKPDFIKAEGAKSRQRAFLLEHLSCWAPEYCSTVENAAKQPFYIQFATLATVFIESDTEELERGHHTDLRIEGPAGEISNN